MMNRLRNLEEEISAWPHVSIHPHRFGGREFRFGETGLGHMHSGGMVDIPFPPLGASFRRSVRDAFCWPEFPSAKPLPSIPSAVDCSTLFGDFSGCTSLSDFPRSFIIVVRP
jgi:hypothetical protein